jgi:Virulence factor membrane-bound polymerase, C-terminal
MMVLMIGLHSLLEYPLWYAYFLLPTAWAWGFALGSGGAGGPRTAARWSSPALVQGALVLGGLLLAAGSAWSVADYQRVAAIFSAPDGAPPLAQRIASGQRSVLFGHHADYAAATTEGALPGTDRLAPFERSTHYLLDTRLMMAWSRALAAAGRDDQARAVAQRLREFRNPMADEFFDACEPASAAAAASADAAGGVAFQCEAAVRTPGWREFLAR